MKLKRILSAICFFISVGFFLVSGSNVTGAAVSSKFEFPFTSSVFGFVFLMIAVSLLAEEGLNLEKLAANEYLELIKKIPQNMLVLDTSVAIEYSCYELAIILQDFDVCIPKSVFDELHNPMKLRILKRFSSNKKIDEKEIQIYKSKVRDYLDKSEKPKLKKLLLPYLENPNLFAKKSRSEQSTISHELGRVRKIMEKEGITLEISRENPSAIFGMIKKYLDSCDVSEGDIDVLATALYFAEKGNVVKVLEKDIDLRQGIELLVHDEPRLKNFLKYAEPYKTA